MDCINIFLTNGTRSGAKLDDRTPRRALSPLFRGEVGATTGYNHSSETGLRHKGGAVAIDKVTLQLHLLSYLAEIPAYRPFPFARHLLIN